MMKDLTIAYRIYPGIAKAPPIFGDDKFRLSELCLKSFVRALGGLDYKLYAVLDSCPEEYERLFADNVPSERLEMVRLSRAGNPGSFGAQLDLLSEVRDSRYVYFAEDDYFYLENAMAEAVHFLDSHSEIDLLTLYDHPDYYSHPLHRHSRDFISFGAREWKSAATTCMTFLGRAESVARLRDAFSTYARNDYDNSMWLSITRRRLHNPFYLLRHVCDTSTLKMFAKGWLHSPARNLFGRRYKLYAATPSLANHLDGTHDAPGIDWPAEYEKLLHR